MSRIPIPELASETRKQINAFAPRSIPTCRLISDEDAGLTQQPARQHHFLLITARER